MTFEEKLNAELDTAIRVWVGRKSNELFFAGKIDNSADLHDIADAVGYPSPAAFCSVMEFDLIPTETCRTLIRQLDIELDVSVKVL
jgi:hypothetical protein